MARFKHVYEMSSFVVLCSSVIYFVALLTICYINKDHLNLNVIYRVSVVYCYLKVR